MSSRVLRVEKAAGDTFDYTFDWSRVVGSDAIVKSTWATGGLTQSVAYLDTLDQYLDALVRLHTAVADYGVLPEEEK